jgi:hypothetical protein
MSRYKGRASPKSLERNFPHIVEMRVPLGGFGAKLDAMHEWHTKRTSAHFIQLDDATKTTATTFDGASLMPKLRQHLPRSAASVRLLSHGLASLVF